MPAQQFVTNLYESFLQRGPDAGGLSWWTAQAGATAQSWNRYAYVRNNPLSLVDPAGLSDEGGNSIKHPARIIYVPPPRYGTATIKTESVWDDKDNEQGLRKWTVGVKVADQDRNEMKDVSFSVTTNVGTDREMPAPAKNATPSVKLADENTAVEQETHSVTITVGDSGKGIPQDTTITFTVETVGNSAQVLEGYLNVVKLPQEGPVFVPIEGPSQRPRSPMPDRKKESPERE